MPGTGFDRYQRFYTSDPSLVVEWHDDQTSARGWLAMNSLRGGAAGGGTRMRVGGNKQEAVFLAKTMEVKFRVAGPDIGGGKSVIDFDSHAAPDVKEGVLRRWYKHVGPYLKACYGTGGDVGVDEVSEATKYIEEEVGNKHPQEGIARGHIAYQRDGEGPGPKIERLRHGVEAKVVLADLPGPKDEVRQGAWTAADVSTGFGVVRAIERLYHNRGAKLAGQRAIIEGFGAVGAFAAYYLDKLGVRIVATNTRGPGGQFRVAADDRGLDVRSLILARDGTHLPAPGRDRPYMHEGTTTEELFKHQAEIFIPAAASHTITLQRVQQLRACGVKVLSCGANNPFHADQKKPTLGEWVGEMLSVQREADQHFAIIPDFIANCGMARTFAYLMNKGGKPEASAILHDIGERIDQSVDRLLSGHESPVGLLDRGYEVFV